MGVCGDFEYEEKNGSVELTQYLGSEAKPKFPEEIDGKRVRGIGAGVFEACDSLIFLEIPQWIFYIGKSAFRGCHNLKEVRLRTGERMEPAGEIVVENAAEITGRNISETREVNQKDVIVSNEVLQENAMGQKGVLQESTIGTGEAVQQDLVETHELRYEEGVRNIGDQAFADCEKLEIFEAKGSFYRVSTGMFRNCRNLKSVTLPEQLEEIDLFAFQGCVNLEEVALLGRNLRFVTETVFKDCKKIRLSYDSKIYKYEELGDFFTSLY